MVGTRSDDHANEQADDDLGVADKRGAKQFSEDDGDHDNQPEPQVDTMSKREQHFAVPTAQCLACQHLNITHTHNATAWDSDSEERDDSFIYQSS